MIYITPLSIAHVTLTECVEIINFRLTHYTMHCDLLWEDVHELQYAYGTPYLAVLCNVMSSTNSYQNNFTSSCCRSSFSLMHRKGIFLAKTSLSFSTTAPRRSKKKVQGGRLSIPMHGSTTLTATKSTILGKTNKISEENHSE